MSKVAYVLADEVIVTAPVNIQVPLKTDPEKVKAGTIPKIQFKTETVFMDFQIPRESEIEELQEEIRTKNRETFAALKVARERRDADGATDKDRADADDEIARLNKELRLFEHDLLKRFVVGLPEDHRIGNPDGTLAEYSTDLVGRLCDYRNVRAAMMTTLQTLLDGEGKRGN